MSAIICQSMLNETSAIYRLQMLKTSKEIPETIRAKEIYNQLCTRVSMDTTKSYSTSFSIGILCLDRSIRAAIYQIYGFVRLADEIVDTFHGFEKESLLDEYERDTFLAIDRKISTNPILHSFQQVVNRYGIDMDLIVAFLYSMRMDLDPRVYDKSNYDKYIYGSAEVVGQMCLYVFVNGDQQEYDQLSPGAKMLGSAFQKINFLRDINSDAMELGRVYFPGVDLNQFDEEMKHQLLDEIELEFEQAYIAIKKLPHHAKFGVFVAYIYYRHLTKHIRNRPAGQLLKGRVRISNRTKFWLLLKAYFNYYCGKI